MVREGAISLKELERHIGKIIGLMIDAFDVHKLTAGRALSAGKIFKKLAGGEKADGNPRLRN